ncbi:MAG: LCP family protein [Enterococcus sp.]
MKQKKVSKKRKWWLIIVGILAAIVIAIAGVGAVVYFQLSHSIQQTYESAERTKESVAATRKNEVDIKSQEPFSILLMGVDTGELGRTEQGRSDAMMVATVNPTEEKTTIVSIPRDTYVEIVGKGTQDKINHAYAFGGAGMAMDTVQNYLEVPIDHYAVINMEGIEQLVDAVGGIEVANEQEFENLGHTYAYGQITLTSENVLGYINMRYDDPKGDYGRQARQRQVIQAIADQLLSFEGVTKYQEVLDTMEENFKTDMTFDEMQTIALDYREAFTTIKTDQLQGAGFMQDGVSYQKVDAEELARVQDELNEQLNQ